MSVTDIIKKPYYDVDFLVTPWHKVTIRFFTNKVDAIKYYKEKEIEEYTWNFLECDVTLYWSNDVEMPIPGFQFKFDDYYATEDIFNAIGLPIYRARCDVGWRGDQYHHSICKGCTGCDDIMVYTISDIFSIISDKIQKKDNIEISFLHILLDYVPWGLQPKNYEKFRKNLPRGGFATDDQLTQLMHFMPIIIKYGRHTDR